MVNHRKSRINQIIKIRSYSLTTNSVPFADRNYFTLPHARRSLAPKPLHPPPGPRAGAPGVRILNLSRIESLVSPMGRGASTFRLLKIKDKS